MKTQLLHLSVLNRFRRFLQMLLLLVRMGTSTGAAAGTFSRTIRSLKVQGQQS